VAFFYFEDGNNPLTPSHERVIFPVAGRQRGIKMRDRLHQERSEAAELLRARLKELMKLQKTNATRLSLAIGRDSTFIRDFLRGTKKGFMAPDLAAIERALNTPQGELSSLAAGLAADQRENGTSESSVDLSSTPKISLSGSCDTKIEPLVDGTFRVRADLIVTSDKLATVIRYLAEQSH
jgi:hypothetical protein